MPHHEAIPPNSHDKRTRRLTAKKKEAITFYIILLPFILAFIFVKLYPFVWSLYLSFTNYMGFNLNNLKFIGLHNYTQIFSDNMVISSFFRTLLIAVIIIPAGTVIGLLIAIMLNKNIKGVGIFRTAFYLPSVIPLLVVGTVFVAIYQYDGGLFNQIVNAFGHASINWMDYNHVFGSLIIMLLWGSGSTLLINLAALKGVPKELYESAEIDGASSFAKTFRITLPMITPIIFYNVVTGLIWALQIFYQPYLLSGSKGFTTAPQPPVNTYVVRIFLAIFTNQKFAYGLAMIWLFFIVIMAVTLVLFKSSSFWVFYDTAQGGEK